MLIYRWIKWGRDAELSDLSMFTYKLAWEILLCSFKLLIHYYYYICNHLHFPYYLIKRKKWQYKNLSYCGTLSGSRNSSHAPKPGFPLQDAVVWNLCIFLVSHMLLHSKTYTDWNINGSRKCKLSYTQYCIIHNFRFYFLFPTKVSSFLYCRTERELWLRNTTVSSKVARINLYILGYFVE